MAISCDKCRDNLAVLIRLKSDVNSGGLSESERREIENHVASCADCTRELALTRAAISEVQSLPLAIAPASLRANVRASIAQSETRKSAPLLDLFRRPSSAAQRAVWAGGSFALAAFAIFLLREPSSPPSAYSPSTPTATSGSAPREEPAPGATASKNSTTGAAAKVQKPVVPSQPRIAFKPAPQAPDTASQAMESASPAAHPPTAESKSTPQIGRTFPAPQIPTLENQTRPSSASAPRPPAPPILFSVSPPHVPAAAAPNHNVATPRFARLEILASVEPVRAPDVMRKKVNTDSAGAIFDAAHEDTVARSAAPMTQNEPQPQGARGPQGADDANMESKSTGETAPATTGDTEQYQMRAAPPAMSAQDSAAHVERRAPMAAPDANLSASKSREAASQQTETNQSRVRKKAARPAIQRRARLTVLPPRDVPGAQIRVHLPADFQFFDGTNSRIVWRGAARKNQAIQIEFGFSALAANSQNRDSPSARITLENSDGTFVAAQTVEVAMR